MKSDLISVIITVFNRENYIKRCIDSVLKQQNVNFEIIIVDDGSTDSSASICDEYASKYDNIRVIHIQNSGLSVARNTGLDNVKGDYIVFLDDDDFLPENSLYTLLKFSKDNDADMVIGNYDEIDEDGTNNGCFEIPQKYCNRIITNREVCELLRFCEKTHVIIVSWGKLFKKNVWNNIRFPNEIIKSEDQFVFPLLMENCSRIYFTDKIVYHQVFSEKSITRSRMNRAHLYHSEGVAVVIQYLLKKGYYDIATFKFGNGTRHLILCRKYLLDTVCVKEIKRLYNIYCDIAKKMMTHVGLKNRIRFILFRMNLDIYTYFQKKSGKRYLKTHGRSN